MRVITGHINADFDCLGAVIAAHRLYPDALLLLPGGEDKGVHDFLARYGSSLPTLSRVKEIALNEVSSLIMVDCQSAERIGLLSRCITNSPVLIHIFDHHPVTDTSIAPAEGTIRPCGSTSTILATELRKQELTLSPMEATAVMLGIYEDTGKLLFPGTTVEDFEVAAWLLLQGADLNIVAEYVSRGLTSAQVTLMDCLLTNLTHRDINGITVSLSYASTEEYIADVSRLAHLMRDMENLDVLFLVVDMGNSISLVARSRLLEVNAGEIMAAFDGGGHATAASATVRGKSLKQVLERLELVMHNCIIPLKTARTIMSSPVKTVTAGISIAAALDTLIRYNCTSMPVLKRGKTVGIISRKTVEKALYHQLGEERVDEYMNTDFFSATPDTPIEKIQHAVIEENQRFVPVFENNALVGAVTRTDLLRYLYNGTRNEPEALYDVETMGFVTRHHSVETLLKKHLSPEIIALLKEFGATGDLLGSNVYVVGGFVRDLFLGVANLDIDITVEGDGILFAEYFVAHHQCRMRSHKAFGTAVILFPDGLKVDIASTRLEYYDSPGGLPTVERSSLRHDLYRRDFTINTLAISLNHDRYGVVTDYFGGRQDLQNKTIKVLHNLSFVEDPSRLFRAIRFEQRLGFKLAPHTGQLIRSTIRLNGLASLSGTRMYNELVLILKEKEPSAALRRMGELGVMPVIHPSLRLNNDSLKIIHETDQMLAWFRLSYLPDHCEAWQVYFFACTGNLLQDEFSALLERLAVPQILVDRTFGQRSRVKRSRVALQRSIRHGEAIRPSYLYQLLHGLALESLLYLAASAREDMVRKIVSNYLTQLRQVHPLVNGEELKGLGLHPGPAYRKILRELLAARLDGEISDKQQELQLAGELVARYQTK